MFTPATLVRVKVEGGFNATCYPGHGGKTPLSPIATELQPTPERPRALWLKSSSPLLVEWSSQPSPVPETHHVSQLDSPPQSEPFQLAMLGLPGAPLAAGPAGLVLCPSRGDWPRSVKLLIPQ